MLNNFILLLKPEAMDRMIVILTHNWIFIPTSCYACINTVPEVIGMRIVVCWRIFMAIIVDDRIVLTPPQWCTKSSDQGRKVDRYKAYTIHSWSHVTYERAHSSSIRAKYLLFLGAFDKEIWDCCFWAGGPRDTCFSGRRFTAGHHHHRSLARNSWWYELEVELAGCLISLNR